jgi:hypothetical protein
MAVELTRLTHIIAIQLHLLSESCTICGSRSRWPVRKLLDTPSYFSKFTRQNTSVPYCTVVASSKENCALLNSITLQCVKLSEFSETSVSVVQIPLHFKAILILRMLFTDTYCRFRGAAQLPVVESSHLRLDLPRTSCGSLGCQLCLPRHDHVGQYTVATLILISIRKWLFLRPIAWFW